MSNPQLLTQSVLETLNPDASADDLLIVVKGNLTVRGDTGECILF